MCMYTTAQRVCNHFTVAAGEHRAMGFVGSVYKQWKPAKIHKRVKLGKFYKKLKVAKLFKVFRPLCRMLFPAAVSQQRHPPHTEGNLAFMTCIIKVSPSRGGWEKAVLKVLGNCKGARFKMDQNGVVELSGIADPNKLLKKLGRSKLVELHWFQFGECSSNLFMPETKKDPNPVQEKPKRYNHPYSSFPVRERPNYYNPPYNSFPLSGGYTYHYNNPPPHLLRQYAPY